jgi:hypothetical protein
MMYKTIRPTSLPHKNNVYYPMGVPDNNEPDIVWHMVEYRDQNLNTYWICYMKKQVEKAIGNNTMICFCPYIPVWLGPAL